MRKKDYELIAAGLKYVDEQGITNYSRYTWESTCKFLALVFEKNNPRFNREKFLKACGITV